MVDSDTSIAIRTYTNEFQCLSSIFRNRTYDRNSLDGFLHHSFSDFCHIFLNIFVFFMASINYLKVDCDRNFGTLDVKGSDFKIQSDSFFAAVIAQMPNWRVKGLVPHCTDALTWRVSSINERVLAM